MTGCGAVKPPPTAQAVAQREAAYLDKHGSAHATVRCTARATQGQYACSVRYATGKTWHCVATTPGAPSMVVTQIHVGGSKKALPPQPCPVAPE